MTLRSIRPGTLLCLTLAAAATGCVERKLTLTSEPSGAIVYMNDREVGRTPIETDFVWYGNYDIQVRKEGYEVDDKPRRLKTPWWQYPPIDLVAELMPWHPTDRPSLHFTLHPRQPLDTPPEELVNRGLVLKPELETSTYPPPVPTTKPAKAKKSTSQPATPAATPTATQASTQALAK